MKKSRINAWLSILFYIGSLGLVICLFLDNFAGILVFFLVDLIGFFAHIASARCPSCDKFGLKGNPFAKSAGTCRKCGKAVEWE